MTTVDFGTKTREGTGVQLVYLKQTWNSAWTLYYECHCLEATWCLSPSMPTATLVYDYGFVKGLGTKYVSVTRKLDVVGWYVKIVLQTDLTAGTSNTWYGVVSHVEDEHRGLVTYSGVTLATGQQTLHCYGLEKLLDTEYIAESFVDAGAAAPFVTQLPITFNRGGRPNMNDRICQPHGGHVFEGQVLTPGGTNRPTAAWWTTWHICDYLIRWMVPKDSFRTRNKRIPFELVNDAMYLPLQDHPVVEQENQTVLALLNRLIDRRRLRSFYTTVDETQTPNVVQLWVVAWNKDLIDPEIDGADIYLPNYDIVSLKYDFSQATSSILRKTEVNRYDRIIVRGARRTTTATFFQDNVLLDLGWTSAQETAYEAGASGEAGYAGWDTITQMQRNAEARGADELSAVFSWFKLPDDWNQHILDCEGATSRPAFVDEVGNLVPQDIHEVMFEPIVPLYEHVDYSDDVIGDGTADDPVVPVYRLPLVVFETPTDERWVAGDAISTLMESTADPEDASDGRNWRWSALVRPQPESRILEVRVSGEPQHVIAASAFSGQTEDRDLGDFDYQSKKMLITATVLDNRYAEGKYPLDGTLDSTLVDQQFGFIIYAGDEFRLDYVVPNTVVDVDAAGALVKSNGGFIRDDRNLLDALARIAYEWWHQERMVLTLTTSMLTSAIQVGDLVDTIGDATVITELPDGSLLQNEHYETVNTVVSELRITWPRLEDNQRDMPMLQFTTGAGELDPMTMMPPRQKIASRAALTRARQ